MRKLLLLLPLFLLVGCTVNQKITYKLNDVSAQSDKSNTIPIKVEIRVFEDNRRNIEDNAILFTENKNSIPRNGKTQCINAEKHYKNDLVVNQIAQMMTNHFNASALFTKATYKADSVACDYYLTGTLNSFYCEQEFSAATAVGASFGLIGALATANLKTPGKVIIDVSNLKLYKKDGTLVKDFGSFYKEYEDKFKTDSACWCAYWTANQMLKDFNTHLVEKIRHDMQDVKL